MTAVRAVESLKYGVALFAYVLGVAVVGGGSLALGLALAWPEFGVLRAGGDWSVPALVGGSALAFLGTLAVVTGLLGLLYKLVADAVAVGVEAGAPELDIVEQLREAASTDGSEPSDGAPGTDSSPTGPSPGEQAARRHGAEQTVPAASGTAAAGSASPGEPESTARPAAGGTAPGDATAEPGARAAAADRADETGPDSGEGAETGSSDGAEWGGPLSAEEAAVEGEGDGTGAPTGEESATSPTGPDTDGPGGAASAGARSWAAGEDRTGEGVPAAESRSEGDESPPDPEPEEQASPPEPTPEEIAFGTSREESREAADEPVEDGATEDTSGESVGPAGSSSSRDPLADPTDDE